MRTTIVKDYKIAYGAVNNGDFGRAVDRLVQLTYQPYGSPFFTCSRLDGAVSCHQSFVLDVPSPEPIPDPS